MKDTPIMQWVNAQSNGEERKQREILRDRLYEIMMAPGRKLDPADIADMMAMAIAEYVLEGICGNEFKREVQ